MSLEHIYTSYSSEIPLQEWHEFLQTRQHNHQRFRKDVERTYQMDWHPVRRFAKALGFDGQVFTSADFEALLVMSKMNAFDQKKMQWWRLLTMDMAFATTDEWDIVAISLLLRFLLGDKLSPIIGDLGSADGLLLIGMALAGVNCFGIEQHAILVAQTQTNIATVGAELARTYEHSEDQAGAYELIDQKRRQLAEIEVVHDRFSQDSSQNSIHTSDLLHRASALYRYIWPKEEEALETLQLFVNCANPEALLVLYAGPNDDPPWVITQNHISSYGLEPVFPKELAHADSNALPAWVISLPGHGRCCILRKS